MRALLNQRCLGAFLALGLLAFRSGAATYYVSAQSTNPVPPYSDWTIAAVNIQDAVAVTAPGDVVLVSNGVYSAGGGIVSGAENNRVAITNPITVISVNGPQCTFISGGTKTRCVYLGANAVLSGFTLTNGYAVTTSNSYYEGSGGGVWSELSGVISNCVIASNYATFRGGGTYQGTVYNSLITSNSNAGGCWSNTLYNCTISGNEGAEGGGVGSCTGWNCTIVSNLVSEGGGGAFLSTLYNSTIGWNGGYIYLVNGGGAFECSLSNCIVRNNIAGSDGQGGGTWMGTNTACYILQNTAFNFGGGTCESQNTNCVIWGNSGTYGGGCYSGVCYNCSICGNTAVEGGGLYDATAYYSIIYFNNASNSPNWADDTLETCCTTPAYNPQAITADPQLVDEGGGDLQLKCNSPCIDVVSSGPFLPATDIRGLPRPVAGNGANAYYDIGAYEYTPAVEPSANIRALPFTNFASGYTLYFYTQIGACADSYYWNFGDGTLVTNQNGVGHAWSSPGTYNIVLSASYSSLDETLSSTTTVQVLQRPIYYVNTSNAIPRSPYTNWATAAQSIQQALLAGTTPGRLVLVTNGTYSALGMTLYGGETDNCAILTNIAVVQSVNGPAVTAIAGQSINPTRCAYVGDYSILSGFTLKNGVTVTGATNIVFDDSGGGVWCEPFGVVTNCWFVSNNANYYGGGGYQGTYYNCVFSNNTTHLGANNTQGGGACLATLNNCLLVSNTGPYAGGCGGAVSQCTLADCVLSNNSATLLGGGAFISTLYNCTLDGNTTGSYGGGADSSTLYSCWLAGNTSPTGGGGCSNTLCNCILVSNRANFGGGLMGGAAVNCTIVNNYATNFGGGVYSGNGTVPLTNCIIYYNGAAQASNCVDSFIYNCCTSPANPGLGCITNPPDFINLAGGDYHLHFGSPCIDAGANLSGIVTNDYDGNPRPLDGNGDGVAAYDIGAYEFNLLATVGTNWLTGYGLNPDDPLVFTEHPNANPYSVLQSWIADLNPNVYTPLQISAESNLPPLTVYFNGSSNRVYTLQSSPVLPPTWTDVPGQIDVPGLGGLTSLQDPNASGAEYYQVVVSIP